MKLISWILSKLVVLVALPLLLVGCVLLWVARWLQGTPE